MPISQGAYIVEGETLEEQQNNLNFFLQQISDRLDKIEGVRGESKIRSDLDMSEGSINSVSSLTSTDIASTNITASGSSSLGAATASTLSLSAAGWDDLTADLSAGKAVGANAPTWSTFRDGIEAYEFSAGTMNEIWITFHINHRHRRNSDGTYTDCYPHIHWSTTSTASTGRVRWGIEYTFAKASFLGDSISQDGFPASTTIYIEEDITSNSQYKHIVTEASDDQAFGSDIFEVDGLLLCRIFRDAADSRDTFAGTVFGLTADLHYQVAQLVTPDKRPPFF